MLLISGPRERRLSLSETNYQNQDSSIMFKDLHKILEIMVSVLFQSGTKRYPFIDL